MDWPDPVARCGTPIGTLMWLNPRFRFRLSTTFSPLFSPGHVYLLGYFRIALQNTEQESNILQYVADPKAGCLQ
jgi:hypothetical protein